MQDQRFDPLRLDDVETGDLTDDRPDKPWPALLLHARVLDGVPVLDLSGRLEGSGVAASTPHSGGRDGRSQVDIGTLTTSTSIPARATT